MKDNKNDSELISNGGETHQISKMKIPTLTTQQGTPVSDDQNTLKIGSRGPSLLEDIHFREKIFHFDHERIHAAKAEPNSDFPQAQTAHDNFWDFISLMPESMHMIMWIMSDRTIPRSFRFMEGFGVHTFRFINKNNESTFVNFTGNLNSACNL